MARTASKLMIVACLVLLASGVAHSQPTPTVCGEGSGVVMGVVINSITRQPETGAVVRLWRDSRFPGCSAPTAADGSFLFVGRPAGTDTIVAAAWNFRVAAPTTVTPGHSDTVRIALVITPGSTLEECMEVEACREWVTKTSPGLTSEEEFLVLAYQTAAVLAWKKFDRPLDAYICVPEDVPPAVFEALARRHSLTAKAPDCKVTASAEGDRPIHRLRHIPSGKPAFGLGIRPRFDVSSRERSVELSHYVAPLWAEGWHCRFRVELGAWRVMSCVHDWIS